MRKLLLLALALCVVPVVGGCSAFSAGRSAQELEVSFSNPGYVERDFADMHPATP